MQPGSRTRSQLRRLAQTWKQGEHIFITGPTGSGKTRLAREIVEIRARNGGHVIVLCMKPKEDETITEEYLNRGFVRWKRMRKPSKRESRIVLWPDVSKAKGNKKAILAIQKRVFAEAFDAINDSGHWTVQVDEGLYACAPEFLNMAGDVGMGHAIGRSGYLTYVTLAQRPSNLPLILYGSASHAFVGRTRELSDQKRLAELGSREGSKALASRISELDRHGFLWVPVAPDWPAEYLNLAE